MTFTLKLVFSGLVTFVPIVDPQDPTKLTAMWVLMVNAEDDVPICSVTDVLNPMYHAHEDIQMVSALKHHGVTGQLGERTIPESLDDIDARVNYTGGRLPSSDPCFKSSDAGDLRRSFGNRLVDQGTGKLAEKPGINPCETTDFTWIAGIDEFSSDFARTCAHCLDEGDLSEVPGARVRARIKLTRGYIEVSQLTRLSSNPSDFAVFQVPSVLPIYSQVLAEEVTVTVEAVEGKVTFELCDFLLDPHCNSKRFVELTPTKENDVVTVRFENEVHNRERQMDPSNDHFLFFYKLSHGTTFNRAAPCPAGLFIPRPRGDFGDPRCPVSRMLKAEQ